MSILHNHKKHMFITIDIYYSTLGGKTKEEMTLVLNLLFGTFSKWLLQGSQNNSHYNQDLISILRKIMFLYKEIFKKNFGLLLRVIIVSGKMT